MRVQCAHRMQCMAQSSMARSIRRATPANGDCHLRCSPAVVPMASHVLFKNPAKTENRSGWWARLSLRKFVESVFPGLEGRSCKIEGWWV